MKMKKVLATMLALTMLSSGAVFAEGTDVTEESVSTIYYTLPFTTLEAGNRIGVNQEEIKAVLNVAVTDEILSTVSFKDKNGDAPAGGIIVTKDESDVTGKTISVKFGELLEGTEYTLSVNGETVSYKTVKKVLVKEDFDEWETKTITLNDTSNSVENSDLSFVKSGSDNNKIYSFNNNPDLLLAYSNAGVSAEIKENGSDKYIEMGKTATGNLLLGAYIKNVGNTDATAIADAKIITDAKFTTSAPDTYLNQVGGTWHYYYANSNNGYPGANDNLAVKNFEAGEDGFYDVLVVNHKHDSVPNDIDAYIAAESKSASGIIGTHYHDFVAYDKIGGGEYTISKTIDTLKAYNSNINAASVVKSYPNTATMQGMSTKVSYYNQGFYTLPETFGESAYNEDLNTLTFTVNTDIDVESLDVTAVSDSGVAETEVTYNALSRQISVELLNPKAETYTISVEGKSADGFDYADTFTADEKVSVDLGEYTFIKTLPDTTLNGNYIGVNQGEIKVVFEDAVDYDLLYSMTFRETNGLAPVGGIRRSIDGNTAIISFGELKENTEYTLAVDDITVATFKTIEKVLVDEDFDDWQTADYTQDDNKSSIRYKFNENNDLKMFQQNAVVTLNGDEDKYITVSSDGSSSNDLAVGAYLSLTYEDEGMTDGKLVTAAKIKTTKASVPSLYTAGLWDWRLGNNTSRFDGIKLSALSEFATDADGFYDVITVSEKYDTSLEYNETKAADLYKSYYNVTAYDMLSDAAVKTEGTTHNDSAANQCRFDSSAAFIWYTNSDASGVENSISEYKTGFFTLPASLDNAVYDVEENDLTFTVNTDLDETTLDNFVATSASGEAAVKATYNKATRKLSLSLVNPEDDLYTISAENVLSEDGFGFMDTYEADRRDAYSISSIKVVDADGNDTDYYAESSFRVVGTFEKNTDKDIDGHVIVALYDDSERLVAVKGKTVTDNSDNAFDFDFAVEEGTEITEAWGLYAYSWLDGMVPMKEKQSLKSMRVDYVIPNPLQATTNAQYIGVNQGYLSVVFNKEVDEETVGAVTFADSKGNAPIGGIYKTVEGNKLTIEFGELTPEEDYTLLIGAGVESIDGFAITAPVSYTYKTYAKLYAEEDFEDFADDFTATYDDSTMSDKTGFIDIGTNGLKVGRTNSGTEIVTTVGTTSSDDKYVQLVQNVKDKSASIAWAPKGTSAFMTEGNILYKVKIAPVANPESGMYHGRLGRIHEWKVADQYGFFAMNNMNDFEKDSDGFYEVQVSTEKTDTFMGKDGKYNAKWNISVNDLLGNAKGVANGEYVSNNVAHYLSTVSIAQIYTSNELQQGNGFRLAYVKCGLFTAPKVLKTEYSGKNTIKLQLNTDMDSDTLSNIVVYDMDANELGCSAKFDSATRIMTITLEDAVPSFEGVEIVFDGVLSADGFAF